MLATRRAELVERARRTPHGTRPATEDGCPAGLKGEQARWYIARGFDDRTASRRIGCTQHYVWRIRTLERRRAREEARRLRAERTAA